MRFTPSGIDGVVVVDIEPAADERGAFARLHCPDEFAAAGHPFEPAQTSLSRNPHAFTLRGMHYQPAPHAEVKLVRVVRGRIFDVAIDLRPDSPTYRQWTATELSAENGRAVLIGEGLAHGFLTLEPTPTCSTRSARSSSRGARPACAGTTRPSGSCGRRPLR
jgi:dTDP-4-dehydrorhamnose 3,5-epimerase